MQDCAAHDWASGAGLALQTSCQGSNSRLLGLLRGRRRFADLLGRQARYGRPGGGHTRQGQPANRFPVDQGAAAGARPAPDLRPPLAD